MGVSDGADREDGPSAGGGDGRIRLGREPSMRLGALVIEPGLRRVAHDDGRQEIVEPRVMQVLVALARSADAIVTREDLLTSCWPGVVVGEDAITRVMSRLRRLADGIGEGQIRLQTITKVGYRLVLLGRVRKRSTADPVIAAAPPPRASAEEPLLAVLAFDNLCDGVDMAWFSDGVSEEILQTVARIVGLRVIGRASSFQFRGAEKAAGRVASALKATHVLDGSVRRSGSTVRIVAHLIECAGETILWSDRFERNLSDVFALQDEIAVAVAAALKIAFAPAAKAEAIDPVAYDLYLSTRTPTLGDAETRAEQIRTLEDAVALAPWFARAWLQLAALRVSQLRFEGGPEPYPIARARVVEAAETALRLDPGLGEAHQTLARLEPFASYVERAALTAKALSVAPNDLRVLYWNLAFSWMVGRLRDGMRYAKRACDLDPLDPTAAAAYADILAYAGRYNESRSLLHELLDRWPNSSGILNGAVWLAGQNSDWSWFDALVKLAHDRGLSGQRGLRRLVRLARTLRDPDRASIANAWSEAHESFARTGVVAFETLTSFYRLGLTDEVFDLIDRASFDFMFDPRGRWPSEITTIVFFDASRNDAIIHDIRFPRLCAKLGLCDYWLRTELWPDCAEAGVLPYDFRAEVRRQPPALAARDRPTSSPKP